MSEDNDIKLAHDVYVESNKINVDELPSDLVAKYEAIDKMFEDYDADQNEDKSTDAIEKASSDLKVEIEAWYVAKQTAPAKLVPAEPKAATPAPAPVVTPAEPKADEEEENEWDYNRFLK